jgi:nucleotidyltransferase/DNA polymerase involved in DNA repair
MELYKEVSERAFAIFGSFTPFVEPVSVDEAFLEVTGCLHLHGDPEADADGCRRRIGEALRAAVRKECGVTCSVGLAPNRLLAKSQPLCNTAWLLPVMKEAFPDEVCCFYYMDKELDYGCI